MNLVNHFCLGLDGFVLVHCSGNNTGKVACCMGSLTTYMLHALWGGSVAWCSGGITQGYCTQGKCIWKYVHISGYVFPKTCRCCCSRLQQVLPRCFVSLDRVKKPHATYQQTFHNRQHQMDKTSDRTSSLLLLLLPASDTAPIAMSSASRTMICAAADC